MKPVDNIECKIKFDVPDGYFDTLADNVMQRIDFDDKQRKKRRSTVVRSIFAMAAAAAIAPPPLIPTRNSSFLTITSPTSHGSIATSTSSTTSTKATTPSMPRQNTTLISLQCTQAPSTLCIDN